MFSNTLDKKPIFIKPNNERLVDITASMFNVHNLKTINYVIYKVPKEFEMRPDLISSAVYRTTEHTEMILKFNGISNPFTIMEDDIILIPDIDDMQILVLQNHSLTDNRSSIRNTYKYIDPTKIPVRQTEFQNRQIVGGAKEGALPPNISREGEQQITFRNGRVYFGESVDTCLHNGMTQSEFLTTVIKSKNV